MHTSAVAQTRGDVVAVVLVVRDVVGGAVDVVVVVDVTGCVGVDVVVVDVTGCVGVDVVVVNVTVSESVVDISATD